MLRFYFQGFEWAGARPSKRRKTARLPDSEVQYEVLPFILLLKGVETPRCTKVRLDSFEAAWRSKDGLINVNFLNVRSIEKLDEVHSLRNLHTANLGTIKEITSFIRSGRAPQWWIRKPNKAPVNSTPGLAAESVLAYFSLDQMTGLPPIYLSL